MIVALQRAELPQNQREARKGLILQYCTHCCNSEAPLPPSKCGGPTHVWPTACTRSLLDRTERSLPESSRNVLTVPRDLGLRSTSTTQRTNTSLLRIQRPTGLLMSAAVFNTSRNRKRGVKGSFLCPRGCSAVTTKIFGRRGDKHTCFARKEGKNTRRRAVRQKKTYRHEVTPQQLPQQGAHTTVNCREEPPRTENDGRFLRGHVDALSTASMLLLLCGVCDEAFPTGWSLLY